MKVYRANLQNFTRVSAETSLYCYAYRQVQFSEALTEFEQYFGKWKGKHSHLSFLYDQRNSLQNIKQREMGKGSYSESNRQHLDSMYKEVRERKIPQHAALETYRRNLLTDFEKELQNQRIGFAQREVRGEDVSRILAEQNSFFKTLQGVQTREKVRYLRTNKEMIDKLTFDLQQLELHSTRIESYQSSTEQYVSALAFVKVISYNEDYHSQLAQFNELFSSGKTYR